jgi:hypothetical protein
MKTIEGIKDWRSAEDYINKGRNKVERPLASGFRIRKANAIFMKAPIEIYHRWHNNGETAITYNPDGTTLIHMSHMRRWDYRTKNLVSGYTHVEFSHRTQEWIDEESYTDEAEIKTCGVCHGKGEYPSMCYKQSTCYELSHSSSAVRSVQICSHGHTNWHTLPCEHGSTTYHKDESNPELCHQCKGAKVYDYGSRQVGYKFKRNVDAKLPDVLVKGTLILNKESELINA